MAERIKYYTQNEDEQRIPELQELAGAAAQQPQTAPAAAAVPTTPAAPVYNSGSGQKQSELYEQIASRGPFQYDPAQDPLYGIARDRYVQQGRMAMRDTMGQAAALTGGYGSSYGQAVGQQQYDAQLQGLADRIPELYQAAYSRYQDEGDRLQRQYQMLGEQEARDYDRYRDALGDWQYERAWQQQQDADAYERANDAYTRLYALISATGYVPTAQELEASGMSQEAADALRNEYLRQTGQLPASGGGSGSGGGRSGGSGSESSGSAAGSAGAAAARGAATGLAASLAAQMPAISPWAVAAQLREAGAKQNEVLQYLNEEIKDKNEVAGGLKKRGWNDSVSNSKGRSNQRN